MFSLVLVRLLGLKSCSRMTLRSERELGSRKRLDYDRSLGLHPSIVVGRSRVPI